MGNRQWFNPLTPGTEPPDFPMTFSVIRPERTGGQLPGRQLADSANLLGCHQFEFAYPMYPRLSDLTDLIRTF